MTHVDDETDEIEVTPEMIEAGAEVFSDWVHSMGYNDTFHTDSAHEPVRAILAAAFHRRSQCETH